MELQRQDGKKEISICDSIVSWNGRKYKKKAISVFRKALCENLSETDLSFFVLKIDKFVFNAHFGVLKKYLFYFFQRQTSQVIMT